MRYSIEKMRKAEKRLNDRDGNYAVSADDLITELTKPGCKPEAGQVVAGILMQEYQPYFKFSSMSGDKYRLLTGDNSYGNYDKIRHLTLAEHGPDVLAMQAALKRIASASARAGCRQFAALVLKDHEIK